MKKRIITKLVFTFLISILFFNCSNKRKQNEKTENKESFIISNKIDTLINDEKYLAIGNSGAIIKIISQKDSVKYSDYELVDAKDSILVVAKNLVFEKFELFEKIDTTITFEKYKVPIYNGTLKEPNFKSLPGSKMFITRITEGCKEGINFAGKYTLITWGCGSTCQSGVIVDRTNGKIYDDYLTAYGSEFRKDSKLIILNSGLIEPNKKLIWFHSVVDLEYKIWDKNKFQDIHYL